MTEEEKIKLLLEQEEKLLASAVARTMQAYNQNSTIANLRDYQAAKKAYEEFKAKQNTEPKQAFKNIPEVLEYLQSEGYKIGKSKLYEDQYKIDRQKDGTMLKQDVDKYAALFLRKLDGSDIEIDALEKLKWETEIARQKAIQLERKNEIEAGNYILRSDVEQQFALRASFLKSSLEGFFHSLTPRMIELAEGNLQRTPEVTEFCLKELEDLLDRYSKPLVFAEPIGYENNDTDNT